MEIIEKLMIPQEEEEEEKEEAPVEEDEVAVVAPPEEKGKQSALGSKKGSKANNDPKDVRNSKESAPEIDPAEEEEEEVKEEPIKFLMNDYMDKAEMKPPKDPYGNDTMHPDLLIQAIALHKIVETSLMKTMSWLLAEKINYGHKVQSEIKDLQDKSVEELD